MRSLLHTTVEKPADEKYTVCLDWFNAYIPLRDIKHFIESLENINSEWCLTNFYSGNGLHCYHESLHLHAKNSMIIAYNPTNATEFDDPSDFDNVPHADFRKTWDISAFSYLPLYASNHPNVGGYFLSLSGDFFRQFDFKDIFKIFQLVHSFGGRCSRLDVACDIFDPDNEIIDILVDAFQYAYRPTRGHHCISSKTHLRVTDPVTRRENFEKGIPNKDKVNSKIYYVPNFCPADYDTIPMHACIQFGSHGSSFGMFRCYDKYSEICSARLSELADQLLDGIDYWYRLEYELHKDHAHNMFLNYVLNFENITIADIFAKAASSMFKVRYAAEAKYKNCSDHIRIDNASYSEPWHEFVESVGKIIHFVQFAKFVSSSEIDHFKLRKYLYQIRGLIRKCDDLRRLDPEFDQDMRTLPSGWGSQIKTQEFYERLSIPVPTE